MIVAYDEPIYDLSDNNLMLFLHLSFFRKQKEVQDVQENNRYYLLEDLPASMPISIVHIRNELTWMEVMFDTNYFWMLIDLAQMNDVRDGLEATPFD